MQVCLYLSKKNQQFLQKLSSHPATSIYRCIEILRQIHEKPFLCQRCQRYGKAYCSSCQQLATEIKKAISPKAPRKGTRKSFNPIDMTQAYGTINHDQADRQHR